MSFSGGLRFWELEEPTEPVAFLGEAELPPLLLPPIAAFPFPVPSKPVWPDELRVALLPVDNLPEALPLVDPVAPLPMDDPPEALPPAEPPEPPPLVCAKAGSAAAETISPAIKMPMNFELLRI